MAVVGRKVNREELAWSAGFFDGEGYTHNRPQVKNGRVPPMMTVAQIEMWPLERLQRALFGIGKIYGPYISKQKNRKPYWQYSIHRAGDVIAVTGLLWKWLGPTKRLQIQTALAKFYSTPLKKSGRPRAKVAA
jgi:hypothetical protein